MNSLLENKLGVQPQRVYESQESPGNRGSRYIFPPGRFAHVEEYALAMQTVTTDEAMQKLPDLLREAKARAVVIQDGDQAVGAIVSMDDYQVVRKAQIEQALKAMNDLGDVLRREAESEGISLEELETMLDTHTL